MNNSENGELLIQREQEKIQTALLPRQCTSLVYSEETEYLKQKIDEISQSLSGGDLAKSKFCGGREQAGSTCTCPFYHGVL